MRKNRFTIIGIVLILLILGYVIYKFTNRPYMSLVIKFEEVPPVVTGFLRKNTEAYYRGYKVGKVSRIELSEDQKYIVFYLDIFYKNLKLPKNTTVILGSEDFYGARHLSLSYPNKPSSQLLSNGDVVIGSRAPERLDKYLVNDLQVGRLGILVDNLLFLTGYLKGATNDLGKIISQQELRDIISQLPQDLNRTVRGIDVVNINIPRINRNIGVANREIASVNHNISRVNQNISETNRNIVKVDETVSQTNRVIPETNDTLCSTNSLLSSTNCNLSEVNAKIPEIPQDLLKNVDMTLENANCLSCELSKILSKRFLLFRFMFGKPAGSLQSCQQGKLYCPGNQRESSP